VERAERSGGLHKRSAEAWGNPLRARGAELPLAAFAVALAIQKFRVGVAGRNEAVTKLRSGDVRKMQMLALTFSRFRNARSVSVRAQFW
jgi:hypothetical protein